LVCQRRRRSQSRQKKHYPKRGSFCYKRTGTVAVKKLEDDDIQLQKARIQLSDHITNQEDFVGKEQKES
jgi:hypothetical protein